MSKLSNRFKDVHEEVINSQYNVKCKCTEELKTLYNREVIDSSMLMGKVTHEFWNNFNCTDTPFLWGYGEGTQKFYKLEGITQNISNTTSVCLLRTSLHSADTNIGIDTTAENTTNNELRLITDMDFNNIVIAAYGTNWDNSVSWWVDDTQRPTAWTLLFKVFYKVNLDGNNVRLLDLTRQVSLGIINDNTISSYLDYWTLSKSSYAVTNNYGDNTLNFGLQGRHINGNFQWYGSQEKTSKNKTSDDKHYIDIGSSYYETPYYRHPIINAIQHPYIIEVIASLGLPFILCNPDSIRTQEDFDNNVNIAYMDDKGNIDYTNILHGRTEINNSDTANKDISYDKLPTVDTNNYIDDIKLNENFFDFTTTVFTKMYGLNFTDEINLKSYFQTAPTGFEPLKSVISLKNYPFDVTTQGGYTTGPFDIGGQSFGTNFKELITSYRILNLGQCSILRTHRNFMDYAPYTDIKLYIPYCSEVNIPPSVAMGKTLSVKLIVDIMSGQCVAVVYCDGIVIAYSAGVIGNDITISSENNALKSAAQLQSMLGVGASVLGIAGGVATGNVLGTLSSAYSALGVVSNALVNENKNYSDSKGATQGIVNNIKPQYCYCTISTVKPDIPDDYAHSVGYVINKKRQLSDCKGFTVCTNVDTTSLRCDDNEKARIKEMLETGVYL